MLHEEREMGHYTKREMGGTWEQFSKWLTRVERDTPKERRDGYHLILWCQLVRLAAIAGQCFGSISKVFIAVIIALPKVISGDNVSCHSKVNHHFDFVHVVILMYVVL